MPQCPLLMAADNRQAEVGDLMAETAQTDDAPQPLRSRLAPLWRPRSYPRRGDTPCAAADRGSRALKGKSAAVQVFGLDEEADARVDLTT
jgi:hypothetical protein